jgi:hypothetical protein
MQGHVPADIESPEADEIGVDLVENPGLAVHTEPVVERSRSRGIVTPIDGEQTVDDVFDQVRTALATTGARA